VGIGCSYLKLLRMELAFRVLNVFTVPGGAALRQPALRLQDGRGVTPERMQALARQLNLSETTFLLPPERAGATARVRSSLPSWRCRSRDRVRLRRGRARGGGGPLLLRRQGRRGRGPATGSACANLGGWLVATGALLPARRVVHQGAPAGRPSRLAVEVDAAGAVRVSGEVVELGRGVLRV
jgi:predicted PhzF superfamily epimerase YddE/YHI9